MRRGLLFAGGLVLVATAYVAWPYWALHALEQAIDERDVATLERSVDWPAVREGVKNDLVAISGSMLAQQDGVLANVFGTMFSALAVEAFVTPQAALQFLPKGNGSFRDHVETVRASFRSPTMFVAEFGSKTEANAGDKVSIVFDFTSAGWKVTRVVLPVERIAAAAHAMRANAIAPDERARQAHEAKQALERLGNPSPAAGDQSTPQSGTTGLARRERGDLERLIQNAR